MTAPGVPLSEISGDYRASAIRPMADGLVEAVRMRDGGWVRNVCVKIHDRQVDVSALVVVLADMVNEEREKRKKREGVQ